MRPDAAPRPPLRPALWGGVAAGFVATVSFWVFHTLWIADVPAVMLEGAVWAIVAGGAIGWAYHHLRAHGDFPDGARGGLLLAVLLWLLLAPYEALGLAIGPLTHLTRPAELAAVAPVGLLGTPLAGLVGWALTRRARSAAALAVAATLAHFMFGGSLVYFGGRGVVLALFAWMLPTYAVAGLVLVRVEAAITRSVPTLPSHPDTEIRRE